MRSTVYLPCGDFQFGHKQRNSGVRSRRGRELIVSAAQKYKEGVFIDGNGVSACSSVVLHIRDL
jgi:hypothetical protein